MQAIHTVVVVLGLTKVVAALIIRVQAILDAMTANKTTFTSPPIALATVQSHLDALKAAETATKTRTLGTTQIREDARKLVFEDCKQLHGYVQQLCNASPAQAAIIAADAAMRLRRTGVRTRNDLTVKAMQQGTVKAVAARIKGAGAHEWTLSTDGGKTWTGAPSTKVGTTLITGLQTGAVVQVRHRPILKAGPGDWSSVVTVVVS